MDISNQIKTRREAMGLSREQRRKALRIASDELQLGAGQERYPDVQSLLMLSVLFDTSIIRS